MAFLTSKQSWKGRDADINVQFQINHRRGVPYDSIAHFRVALVDRQVSQGAERFFAIFNIPVVVLASLTTERDQVLSAGWLSEMARNETASDILEETPPSSMAVAEHTCRSLRRLLEADQASNAWRRWLPQDELQVARKRRLTELG